jgi:tetratricopeptide (TPR) repeat protein
MQEFDRAVELFHQEGDNPAEAMALCNLAYTFERLGRIDDGIRAAERGLELCSRGQLRHLEATTCLALGLLHGLSGNRDQEVAHHERSLSIYADIGYDRGRARALYNLGVAWRSAGREDEAVPALESAIELTDQLGLMNSAVDARTELASIYCAAGCPDLALDLCAEAISISVQAGGELAEARARHAMGNALNALRRSSDARREWYAAQLIYEQLGAPTADEVRQLVSDLR